MTVITTPTPLYQNLPIDSDFYQPSRFVISAISLGTQTTITTSTAHNYVLGQLVRVIIPPSFGTRQLNGQSAYVIAIPSTTQVTINIDSQSYDAFVASSATTKAQILAIGDINTGTTNSNSNSIATAIPGSFINISPQ